jgi:cytochrome c
MMSRLKSFALLILAVALCGSGPATAQDAALGEKLFQRCRACHQVGEGARNLVGPELNGVIGRPAASLPGYSYSTALKGAGFTWDVDHLKRWLKNPRELVPGTKMIFAGLPKDEDVADLLAYLGQFDPAGKKTSAAVPSSTGQASSSR